LALARGAALASVNGLGLFDDSAFAPTPSQPKRRIPKAQAAPLAMLIGGVLTFVVSASVAIGVALLPDRGSPRIEERTMVNTAETPTRPAAVPAPPPAQPPLPAPPPETMSEPVPMIAHLEEPPAAVPVEPPADAPLDPAAALPPPLAESPTVPPVPEKPTLRERILERLPGMHAEPQS
jgi:hypothetical protein